MLQSEFEERLGKRVTGDEYGKIEAVYNELQMDKDEFVKLYKNNPTMYEELRRLVARTTYAERQLKGMCSFVDGMCERLLVRNEEIKDPVIGTIANEMCDPVKVATIKLENNLTLDERDKELIINALKKK